MRGRTEEGIRCSNCGAEARVVRGTYRFRESGLENVKLRGINLIKCPKCRNVDPIIERLNDLMRLLAVAVIAKPKKLKGDEIRFLRKYLNMTGEQFSKLIHVDKTTLSKWENNEDVPGDQSDRLIRAMTLGLGEGLKEKTEQLMRNFGAIQGTGEVQITLDSERGGFVFA